MQTTATLILVLSENTQTKPKNERYAKIHLCEQQHGTGSDKKKLKKNVLKSANTQINQKKNAKV